MRTCNFCERWFKNKQAVRRHLGYCKEYLNAERRERPWTRVELYQCAACVTNYGTDYTPTVTHEEMHEQAATHGGCGFCGRNEWRRAGWKRVPIEAAP